MANPLIYAKVTMLRENYRGFSDHIKDIGLKGMDAAGREGAIAARAAMTRVRTGESKRRIGYKRPAGQRIGSIYVGTVQGSIQNFGTDERSGPRGRVTPLRFLEAGLKVAMARVLSEIRRRA